MCSILSGGISPAVSLIIYMARLCLAKLTASGGCMSTLQRCPLVVLVGLCAERVGAMTCKENDARGSL